MNNRIEITLGLSVKDANIGTANLSNGIKGGEVISVLTCSATGMVVEVIVATLGYDADFALRRLTRGAPMRALFLALRTDDTSWARVNAAFNLIRMFCSYSNVTCVLEPIGTERPVVEVFSILRREVESCSSLELFLTGGPRVLVVSTLIAALLLPQGYASKVKAVVEGEGFNASVEVSVGLFQKILSLGSDERNILAVLLNYEQGLTAPEISRKSGVPKTSTYRKLNLLKELNLVEQEDSKYRLAVSTLRFLKLIPIGST